MTNEVDQQVRKRRAKFQRGSRRRHPRPPPESKFGRTWWGKLWLNSFIGIDFENRIPRGRQYANPSRVPSLEIKGTRVTAPVQGRRRHPYRVKVALPSFTKSERKRILRAVSSNPFVLGELLNGQLPQEIYKLAKKHDIDLLPKDWNSLEGTCSCPDWAVPCKHLAAVIYLLANEIDKNPFLIFRLHGMDLLAAVKKRSHVEDEQLEQSVALEQPVTSEITSESRRSPLQLLDLDLSAIPELGERLFTLLQERPLFHEKDFREILKNQYARTSLRVARLEPGLRDDAIDVRDYLGHTVYIDSFGTFVSSVDASGEVIHKWQHDWIEDLFRLRTHGLQSVNEGDAHAVFWYVVFRVALKLLTEQAFVPRMVAYPNGESNIRWEAATIDGSITAILKHLYELCPLNMLQSDQSEDNGFVEPKQQVDGILNLLLTHFISLAFHFAPQDDHEDTVQMWFFTGVRHKFEWFGSRDTPQVVQRWLNCLSFRDRTHRVLMFIQELLPPDESAERHELSREGLQISTNLLLGVTFKVERDTRIYSLAEIGAEATSIPDGSRILSDLAFLSTYFPDLSVLLQNSARGAKDVRSYTFAEFTPILLQVLPVLRLLGVNLVLPKSLDRLLRPKLSVRVSRKSKTEVKSYLQLNDIVAFDWQVALGETKMSQADFLRLVEATHGLVHINGEYVFIDSDEAEDLAARLDELPNSMSSMDILRAGLAEEFNEADVEVDDSFNELLTSIMQIEPVEIPEELCGTLRAYQRVGFQWLVKNATFGFGSLLADDMGLGKTIQVICFLLHQKAKGELKKSGALVVAPTSVLTNWRREIERFAPSLNVKVYHGTARDLTQLQSDVILTSYGVIRSDVDEMKKNPYPTLVIDEAQNIKNPDAGQTKAIKQIQASNKIALSGTPVENRLLDYWSIFDFAMPRYLGSRKKFTDSFAKPIELDRNQDTLGSFRKVTAPFILRRVKSDKSIISDLPDKIESNRFCSLTTEQAALYQKTVDDTMHKIDEAESKIKRNASVLNLMLRLKQICNSPSHFLKRDYTSTEESGKLSLFVDILGEALDADEKVLIFSQFAKMGEQLVTCVEAEFGFEPAFLHGGVSRTMRDKMIDSFQNDSKSRAMVLSLKAGGTGVNLTAANQVVHYDLWWNPAVENQATDRAFRIGQTKNVLVHRLITENTFEERIDEMIQDKKAIAEMTVADGEISITELSTDEIREIVELR